MRIWLKLFFIFLSFYCFPLIFFLKVTFEHYLFVVLSLQASVRNLSLCHGKTAIALGWKFPDLILDGGRWWLSLVLFRFKNISSSIIVRVTALSYMEILLYAPSSLTASVIAIYHFVVKHVHMYEFSFSCWDFYVVYS